MTAVEEPQAGDLKVFSPRELYFVWERRPWATGSLDFAADRAGWAALAEEERAMLLHSLAPFFAGEERVAAAFPPIILAAEDEQEAAFLSTQQVDEARHMQFFDRLWNEVLAYDEPAAEAAVQDARRRCNEAFTELFDRRLMDAVDRLRLTPTDTEAKVGAVALYHLVIEGTMGLTGQHFIHDYLERKGTFPTTATGFRNVMRDEHRHVAYGTWFLRRRCAEGDRYGQLVQSLLMETLPIAASVLIEGGVGGSCDGLDEFDFLDYQSEELNHFALSALARRLKLIGGATEEIQRFAASGAWRAARVL